MCVCFFGGGGGGGGGVRWSIFDTEKTANKVLQAQFFFINDEEPSYFFRQSLGQHNQNYI